MHEQSAGSSTSAVIGDSSVGRSSIGRRHHKGGISMRCPFCRYPDSRVIDSREVDDGQAIRRRRSCPECLRRFTTVEGSLLSVVKRSGVTEPFSRSKVIAGVTRACQGRPVDADALALLAQQVEEAVRAAGQAEVQSQDVGLAILGPLRELDEVAYLRFASVYKSFSSAEDFAAEISDMRSRSGAAGGPSATPVETTSVHESAVDRLTIHPPAADRPPPVGVG
jgi:transcriptional repressor NrdR